MPTEQTTPRPVHPSISSTRSPARTVRALQATTRFVQVYPYVPSCVLLTLAFLGVAQAIAAHIGVPIRDPEGALLGRRMISPVLLMVVFAYLDSLRRARRLQRGGTQGRLFLLSLTVFRERWWWKRLALAVIGFMSFAFTYLAYRNLKSFVSLIDYRTYDPELLALDRWMAFGNDPATLLHNTLGTGFMAEVLSWIYLVYIPLVAVTVSAALAFVERMREAYVFVATYMWCWILGTASYYAIPTLGPFASRERLFDDLPHTNVERVQDALKNHRYELYADNIGDDVVAGIAGFASLHVGVVFAVVMLMRYYRNTTLTWASIIFLVPTTLATIYFGWHFIVDDIAGVFIGWLAFVLGRATVYPRILLVWRRRAHRELANG
ncbi:MAG: hypothetical protein JWM86_2176 [Thermoleophilia bacterium]|nr:hypothetical protein [Thermoleophilia bacterium]